MLITFGAVVAGAFIGGFVSGLAGFGTGLVALGIWLFVVQPSVAASLVLVCSVVSQISTFPTIWRSVQRARVLPFIVPGLAGVPFGTMLLRHVSASAFRIAVAILLLGFSVFMLWRTRPRVTWGGPWADGVVGFCGGVLGGFAGLSGPLPTIWATLRGWGKDERRSVFQSFNLTILVAASLVHAASGLFTAEFGKLVLVALPGTLLGAALGVSVYRRVSDQRFEQIVLVLLGISGIALLAREL
ncbi:MAG TPA: sulfite exporter TauE/SafE family protein [Burkholderiales bacterium]|nr:sulfite exporter TauE/SafE family protein [Burkholderiales bacterium]